MSDLKNFNKLFDVANKARTNSYSPYSNFKVGAAILTEDGEIHSGANVEDVAYKAICAEVSAISSMVTSSGRKLISEVVVVGGSEGDGMLTTPCGHCRQYLREHLGKGMIIHVAGPEGHRRSFTLDELLPFSFGPENLKGRP